MMTRFMKDSVGDGRYHSAWMGSRQAFVLGGGYDRRSRGDGLQSTAFCSFCFLFYWPFLLPFIIHFDFQFVPRSRVLGSPSIFLEN